MAFQIKDRVKETSNSAGTGALTLGGAVKGFKTFSSVCSVGDTFNYTIQEVDSNGNPTGAWEVGTGSYGSSNTLVRTTTLASSNGTAIVSFGTNPKQIWIDAPAIYLPHRRRPSRIIPIGDSLIQNSSTFSNGAWQFGNGFAELSIYRAGPQFQIMRNAGIAGQTTTQILARIGTDVLAYNPDICYLQGGTNDLNTSITNAQIQLLMNNLEKMVLALLQCGIEVFLMTIPPNNTNYLAAKKVQWFMYALAKYYNLPLCDMYRMTVDPAAATAAYKSGYTSDGTHPSSTATDAFASEVGAILSDLMNTTCPPYLAAWSESASASFDNLIQNGCFAHQTSPPAPDSWTINSTNANYTTPAAEYPYTGNTFKYVLTSNANGQYALSGAAPATGWSVGDVLEFSGHIRTSNITVTTSNGFTLGLDLGGSSANVRPMTGNPYSSDFVFSHQWTVPAGTTSITPTLFVHDIGTYEVNNLTLINVTQHNAIWQPGQQIT